MQSLQLTGMFGDLPAKAQAHPVLQDRVWAAMPIIDEAPGAAVDLPTRRGAIR